MAEEINKNEEVVRCSAYLEHATTVVNTKGIMVRFHATFAHVC